MWSREIPVESVDFLRAQVTNEEAQSLGETTARFALDTLHAQLNNRIVRVHYDRIPALRRLFWPSNQPATSCHSPNQSA